jgi:hypothetical protein
VASDCWLLLAGIVRMALSKGLPTSWPAAASGTKLLVSKRALTAALTVDVAVVDG